MICSGKLFSQNKKPVSAQKPVAKPVAPKPVFKNLCDSASYTAGIHIVNKYGQQNIHDLNANVVARAVNDLQTNKPQLLSNADADNAVFAYQSLLLTNPKPPFKKPVPGVVLNNLRDSASYAAGIYLVSFFREFDIVNFNPAIITKALNDLQNKKQPLLNDSVANMAVLKYQYKLQETKNKPTIDAGNKFLADNKKKSGISVTKSGLQIEIITQGTGPTPTIQDKVSCNYIGSYIDGTEFENSNKSGQPVTFSVNGVIKGWTEALLMMPVGSKWKLYIPYSLGYGPGDYHAIPGGSVLIFEIELLSIAKD